MSGRIGRNAGHSGARRIAINIAGCRLRVGADPALDDRDRFPGRRGFGIDLEAAQISIKRRPARSGIAQSRVFNVAEHAAGSQASGPRGRSHGHSQNILERYAPGLREARAIPANMRMVSLPAQCCASVYGAGGAATSASARPTFQLPVRCPNLGTGLTLRRGRTLMHRGRSSNVRSNSRPLLGRGAGGRSPGSFGPPLIAALPQRDPGTDRRPVHRPAARPSICAATRPAS
jgi:hypothetical protein